MGAWLEHVVSWHVMNMCGVRGVRGGTRRRVLAVFAPQRPLLTNHQVSRLGECAAWPLAQWPPHGLEGASRLHT